MKVKCFPLHSHHQWHSEFPPRTFTFILFDYFAKDVTITFNNIKQIILVESIEKLWKLNASPFTITTSGNQNFHQERLPYCSIIRPTVTYACKKETIQNKLIVFERKVLRRIFGPTKEKDGTWRIKTNDELDELIRHKNIINHTKAQRLC